MPHIKRTVEPVLVSRGTVDPTVRDEFECMTNNTLANVIRELSSLSRHAEDMFRELSDETTKVFKRGSQLQRRIEDVRDKVTQLNPNVDVLNLKDIHLQKPFKSSIKKEQQVLSRSSVPRAILEVYTTSCDAPPALDKLDRFREDGKSSMKFYTDPSYFAELWAIEMGKQIEENKKHIVQKKKGKERHQTRKPQIKQAVAVTRERQKRMKHGPEFINDEDTNTSKRQANKDQQDAARQRHQQEHDQALAQQQQQQLQYQQQQQELKRQSQRQQQQQQLAYHQKQQQQQQHNNHGQPQQYQNWGVPPYQQQTGQYTHIPDAYNEQDAHNHHPPPPAQFSQQQARNSPDKIANGSVGNRKTITSPNRPVAPPPAPPSNGRDSLPPPPSPPPTDYHQHVDSVPQQRQRSMSPQGNRVMRTGSQRDSPVRQGSRDPADLPPPPPSPPFDSQPVLHNSIPPTILPPPPSPPPLDNMHHSPPPPPPPPPLPPSNTSLLSSMDINGDSVSVSSASTIGVPAAADSLVPPVGADRSKLMQEILQVDVKKKLRKMEARTHKKEAPVTHGALDVQALMDKAIEMRRKVIEISDSGGDDSEGDDSDWGSDD